MNPIFNAGSLPLSANPGTLPNMAGTLNDWFQQLSFTTIVKTIVNYVVVETPTTVTFMGVKQPFTPEQLAMKPEGQRSWNWFMIHSYPSLALKTDEIISFNGELHRVMARLDYTDYGYLEYHVVRDYTP